LIRRGRLSSSRQGLLDDLKEVDNACEQGLKLTKSKDPVRAEFLRLSGMAKMERASYEIDPVKKETLLTDAITNLKDADEIPNPYRDYTCHALGNTYEDLAWLAKKDPETNYRLAISAFAQAIFIDSSSALYRCSRGRCYVKFLLESKDPNPKALSAEYTRDD